MKRKKYSLWILLFGFFGILFPYTVFADDYSFTMTVRTSEQALCDVGVSIYRVGDVDESGRFYFTGEFLERTEDLNGLTASEAKELASKLVDFVRERQIIALSQQNTDVDGKVSKTEAVNLGDNEDGSTVDSPSTYDSIWFYVILAIVSFFGMIAFVIYFLVKRKKKNQVTQ